NYPESYKYTKEHEWVHVEGEQGTVGITDHAQHELGDIVFVDLPRPGKEIVKGQSFGSVESVKAVSDVYAPVSGALIEANEDLKHSPEKLNQDPHGGGWLVKVKLSTLAELKDLLSAAEYERYIGAEKSA
ncbi:MAG: glycine cleavage system protein GcvH, partial [Bryobacteraceae bacterium]